METWKNLDQYMHFQARFFQDTSSSIHIKPKESVLKFTKNMHAKANAKEGQESLTLKD